MILKVMASVSDIILDCYMSPWRVSSCGLSYRSEIKVTHSGDLKISLVDPVGGEADVVFPPSVTWGIAYSRIKPFVFEFDVTWTGWSTYN